jgi:internalin A
LDLSRLKLNALPDVIGQLTSLQSLYLFSNQLSNLPPEIGKLTSLQSLELASNQLSSCRRKSANSPASSRSTSRPTS